MSKNGFKLILIRDGHFGMRQFTVSIKTIVVFSLVIVLGITASLFLFSDYFAEWAYQNRLNDVRKDNVELVEQINEYDIKIKMLNEQLDTIITQDNMLRDLVKLPRIHEDIRKMGVGGKKSKNESSNLDYLLPSDNINLNDFKKKFNHLHRLVNLESLSYTEIVKKAERNVKRLLSYPAIHPIDIDKRKLTSDFGNRRDPYTRKYRFHDGHDFSSKTGTPVYATADGIVKISKYYGTYGNYIEIDHGYGYKTVFGHMYKRKVKVGERVERGQLIGSVGNTGRSTGPHLHYEIKYKNKPVDPNNYYFDYISAN
jgi:murein DD-endopeptidase MepM/ murein hydrolase activator NlpD